MEIFHNIQSFQEARKRLRNDKKLGLVPTMGALHAGHASLVKQAVANNEVTAVSIFVNPTQFGAGEDLDKYPRTLAQDCALLESLGVDWVFAPTAREIYPEETQILFALKDLDKKLCGATRPGHFNGVIQVVSILFHIIRPDRAYFGLKDYQQFQIIRQMVNELHFQVEPVPCPIVRESDGLALSSRNVYLSGPEREQALFLYNTLSTIKRKIEDFQTASDVKDFVHHTLAQYPLAKLDYFEILNDKNLGEVDSLTAASNPRAFVAAFVGKTRLIDNMALY
jgi:pantoate--beta-alanine ligase